MRPERRSVVDGQQVEEYYWAGKMVVYVDHHATDESFEAACRRLKENTDADNTPPTEAETEAPREQ